MPASSDAAAAAIEVRLPATVALHARPASDFVRAAMGFEADIWLGCGEREVNAKSLLSILALGATGGTSLRVRAEGPDGPAAVDALAGVIEGLHE